MIRTTQSALSIFAALTALAAGNAAAQNVAHGNTLYHSICVFCHGDPPVGGPELAANNPTLIQQAINSLVPQMGFMKGEFSFADLTDIAAYIATVTGGAPPPPPVPTLDYTDMWYNPNESGWGLNVIQHSSNIVFAVIFTYDAPSRPMWFVLPAGTWTSSTTYTGTLYQVAGAPANMTYTAPGVTPVGTATLLFTSATTGNISYSVNGTLVTKSLTRQPF